MTDILLLGTFHFEGSDIDFYSEKTQQELKALVAGLARFAPNKVAIELAAHEQEMATKSYQAVSLSDFDDIEKMKTQTLGSIQMWGDTQTIRYQNEGVQVAYRLAKQLDLPDVYAIDEDMELDDAPFVSPTAKAKQAMDAFQEYMQKNQSGTILGQYKDLNSAEWSRMNHNVYLAINATCDGAKAVSRWYERNLKIFSNLQRLVEENDRIFVLYGAGHLQILRDLINASDDMRLVDVYEYL